MKLVWHVTLTRDSAGRPEDPAPLWEAVSAFGDAITRRPSALVEPFEEVVEGLVRDGADVIVSGGQIFGALLHHTGYPPAPVPIIDCDGAGRKAAEALVDLGRTTGLRASSAPSSPFLRVPEHELDAAYDALRTVTA